MKVTLIILMFTVAGVFASVHAQVKRFTEDLRSEDCSFESSGRNRYFILEPGYKMVLENPNGTRLVISVLNETRRIGGVETRVVEENESENGKTVEISRNYFAFCKQTGSVYYFGEDVDIYENGKVVSNEGSWLAEGKNKPGIGMPGNVLIGARYYQEIAPGTAMDRAEIVSLSEVRKTPAGEFQNCLKTEETNALKPREREFKFYAPGIGLIGDEDLVLVKYGFIR